MFRYSTVAKELPQLVLLWARGRRVEFEDKVFDMFLVLGGVYVKFLQIIAINGDLFKEVDHIKKVKVYAESKPSSINHLAVIEQELTQEAFSQISYISHSPMATGSFANVYTGTLSNGAPVVIKVKRPNLERQLRFDLVVLKYISRLIGSLNPNSKMDIKKMAKEYSKGVKRETNYRKEVRNANKLKQEYQQNPKIIIPETYRQLSTNNIIVQERMDGVLLSEAMKQPVHAEQFVFEKTGSSLRAQLSNILADMLIRTFDGRMIHGDPHPGNIILMSDNRASFIDFGLVADPTSDPLGYYEYTKEQHTITYGYMRPGKLSLVMFRQFSRSLYYSIKMIDESIGESKIMKGIEQESYRRFLRQVPDPDDLIRRMQEGYQSQLFDQAVNPNNELSVDPDMDSVVTQRARATIWITTIQLGLYKEIVPGAVAHAMEYAQSMLEMKSYKGAPYDIEEAFEIVGDWLANLRESDPIFWASVKKFFPERGEVRD